MHKEFEKITTCQLATVSQYQIQLLNMPDR
jgi:hypothetical protein